MVHPDSVRGGRAGVAAGAAQRGGLPMDFAAGARGEFRPGALGRRERRRAAPWLVEFKVPWIPDWGVSFSLAMDGVSLVLVLLTDFLGVLAVAASWRGIQERVGFFHFNLMCVTAAITGGFLAMDLFLFYVFWEVMLVPLYFLIVLWGHERRIYAAIKFFSSRRPAGC